MQETIILKETEFCKLKKINSFSRDIFSLIIVHTSYKVVAATDQSPNIKLVDRN